ncbi:hypothetical protein ACOSQ2_016572 [Xanthoceras sorbifolium]
MFLLLRPRIFWEQLQVSSGIQLRGNSSHFLASLFQEREILKEQVAALKAKKASFEDEQNATRERDILRERVVALEVEKVIKVAEKDEAVALANKLLDDAVMARRIDRAMTNNMNISKTELQKARKIWRAHCRRWKLPVLEMHIEIPDQEGHPKVYANDKAKFNILGSRMDDGLNPDFYYILSVGKEDLALSKKEESESESGEDQIPFSKFAKSGISSNGTDAGQGSGKGGVLQNPGPSAC